MEGLSWRQARQQFGGNRLVQDIEWSVSRSRQQRERFTTRSIEIFSELALIQTAIQEIFLFEPIYGYFDANIIKDGAQVRDGLLEQFTPNLAIRNCFYKESLCRLYSSQLKLNDEYGYYVAQPGNIQVTLARSSFSF
jgi:hypothetical protein